MRIQSQRRMASAKQQRKPNKEIMLHTITGTSLGRIFDARRSVSSKDISSCGCAYRSSAGKINDANNPVAAAHSSRLRRICQHLVNLVTFSARLQQVYKKIVHEIGEAIFLARPCESPPPPAHLNTTLSSGAQKTSSALSY